MSNRFVKGNTIQDVNATAKKLELFKAFRASSYNNLILSSKPKMKNHQIRDYLLIRISLKNLVKLGYIFLYSIKQELEWWHFNGWFF